MSDLSPRVNSALLSKYQSQTVRLTCKTLNFGEGGKVAVVEASDGGTVHVRLTDQQSGMSETYVDVIGTVIDASTISRVLYDIQPTL